MPLEQIPRFVVDLDRSGTVQLGGLRIRDGLARAMRFGLIGRSSVAASPPAAAAESKPSGYNKAFASAASASTPADTVPRGGALVRGGPTRMALGAGHVVAIGGSAGFCLGRTTFTTTSGTALVTTTLLLLLLPGRSGLLQRGRWRLISVVVGVIATGFAEHLRARRRRRLGHSTNTRQWAASIYAG